MNIQREKKIKPLDYIDREGVFRVIHKMNDAVQISDILPTLSLMDFLFSSSLSWREPSWTRHPTMTTARTTPSSTPQPASTRPPWQPMTSRRGSPCPATPSGFGLPSPPPLGTLWSWEWCTPSLSEWWEP